MSAILVTVRAGRSHSLSILQRRASMALPAGSVNIESENGSLDSPNGFGKDAVNRFMVGYGQDKAAARKAMQRTYVSSLFQPIKHFSTVLYVTETVHESWQ
jgi:hypothetical protein